MPDRVRRVTARSHGSGSILPMSTPTSVREDEHAPVPARGAIDRFFKITERGSTIGAEIRGGLVTFAAMAYIIALNPLIIGTAQDGTGKFLGGSTDAPNLAMVAAVSLAGSSGGALLHRSIARVGSCMRQ